MEKLAMLGQIIDNPYIDDRTKIAFVRSHLKSLATDEEKISAIYELDAMTKVAWLGAVLKGLGRGAAKFGWKGGSQFFGRQAGRAIARSAAQAAGTAAAGATAKGIGRGAKWMLGGGAALGLGGALYGHGQKHKAYKQGYGLATSQLSPMVSALHGPRGAMGMNNYRASGAPSPYGAPINR